MVVVVANTDSDVHLLLTEKITTYFSDMVKNRHLPLTLNRERIMKRLEEVKSKVMKLKWSYLPIEQVLHSKELRAIEKIIKEIIDSFPKNWQTILEGRGIEGKRIASLVTFIQKHYFSLRERLKEHGFSEDYGDTIDIYCGEVLQIESIDKENWKCMVTDDHDRYNVITNIDGIKKGEVIPIARLPPQVIHGVLSEGMFMVSDDRSRFTKDDIGKRPSLTEKELGQARGIIKNFFDKKKS
jgi:hypothetical protein